MRITAVRGTVVSVPYREPETYKWGRRYGLNNVVVEIDTEDGLTGLGEIMGFPSAEVCKTALDVFTPLLIGQDAFDVEAITKLFYGLGRWHYYQETGNNILAGIEMALWDLIGKAAGQPVYRLMGGLVNERINFFRYLQRKPPAALAEDAIEASRQGFTVMYIKVGVDPVEDVECVRAVREKVGDGPTIRVDANEAWTPAQAIDIIRKMAPYTLEFVEQPTPMHDIDGLAYVRRSVPVPIAINQGVWLAKDVLTTIQKGAADYIVTDPYVLGGLAVLKHVGWLAEVAGIPLNKHSFPELGICTAACMQVCATLPNLTTGNQTYGQIIKDDVIVEDLVTFTDGCMTVPKGPGLGVTLDRDKLARYHDLYRKQGPFMVEAVH